MTESAIKVWNDACSFLQAPTTEECWKIVQEHSAKDDVWHSLVKCVSYQAKVWLELLAGGVVDVTQPAAFKLALILRHTPMSQSGEILKDLLGNHPQSQDLTSYIITLITDDEPLESPLDPNGPPSPVPQRDLQLFGDCELVIMAADPDEYKAHCELIRSEYTKMNDKDFAMLRIRILEQFAKIPRLFNTPEFERFEKPARRNIVGELKKLKTEIEERKK